MTAQSRASSSEEWVDVQRGLVSREIFVSDDVCRLELERIFGRTWIFLAHETEVPKPGDFVSRNMGQTPVVVVRDNEGKINVLLNSCRHRGAKVCRADSGNARHFVCPYHGWTYEQSGRLMTTTFDKHFPKGFDFSQHGLVRVPRIETHKGLIFGSWNENVEPLADYLGEIAW